MLIVGQSDSKKPSVEVGICESVGLFNKRYSKPTVFTWPRDVELERAMQEWHKKQQAELQARKAAMLQVTAAPEATVAAS